MKCFWGLLRLFLFGIVPVFYYVFDYIATVYTGLLYNGNIIISEFVPFLLCIYYLSFCVIYYIQYEEKQEIATRNMLLELRQKQSEREVKTLQQSEKAVTLIRHDMLHFLNNILLFIENGEYTNAQDYIKNIIQITRSTSGKRYCTNRMVNMIPASYGEIFSENEINYSYTVNIPEEISISDTDITSILSNALDNALHAVMPLDSNLRIIELHMTQKGEKLLIRLSNSYAGKTTKRSLRLSLRQKLGRLKHKIKKAYVESTLKSESHSLDEVIEYILNRYGFVEVSNDSDEIAEEYQQMRASFIIQYAPELLGEYAAFPELKSKSKKQKNGMGYANVAYWQKCKRLCCCGIKCPWSYCKYE